MVRAAVLEHLPNNVFNKRWTLKLICRNSPAHWAGTNASNEDIATSSTEDLSRVGKTWKAHFKAYR